VKVTVSGQATIATLGAAGLIKLTQRKWHNENGTTKMAQQTGDVAATLPYVTLHHVEFPGCKLATRQISTAATSIIAGRC
jgi:hypothetical protein